GSGGAAAGSGGAAAGSGGAGGAAGNCRGPLLPGATCDHVQQCGCESDENCQFDGAEPPRCQPAGSKKRGELCKTNPDCGKGLICVRGVCRGMCREDGDCDDDMCLDATYDDKEVEGLKFCLDLCDPVVPSGCTATTGSSCPCLPGATCLPHREGYAACVVPSVSFDRDPGERCTSDEECFAGGCISGVCHRWCSEDTDCLEEGETCRSGSGRYARQGREVGYCE
ncbi:MAG TPA: hypothetical protein VJR89_43100, partial [Polyangiales bacterium]|nr:hypothetical protein [Polyangiales bacterium]